MHAVLSRPDMRGVVQHRVASLRRGRSIERTLGGRLTTITAEAKPEANVEAEEDAEDFQGAIFYLPVSAVAVGVAGWLVGDQAGQYWRGYVIYGLIAIFLVIVPNAVAYFSGRDFPSRLSSPRSRAWKERVTSSR